MANSEWRMAREVLSIRHSPLTIRLVQHARPARPLHHLPRRRPGAHPSRRAQPPLLAGRRMRRAGARDCRRGAPASTTNGRSIFGELIPRVQRGIAKILALPDPATIAFAPNTHDFVMRLFSACRMTGRRACSPPTASSIPSRARSRGWRKTASSSPSASPTEPFDSFPARFARRGRSAGTTSSSSARCSSIRPRPPAISRRSSPPCRKTTRCS